MSNKLFNLFKDNSAIITHCPVCSKRYNPVEAKVLEERDTAHLIYITCKHCHSAILALIVANNLGISSVGLITDLTSQDVLKFKSAKAINCDDVIELHQFLVKEKALINYLD